IDLSARTKHNALLDTQLLAGVYVELIGARQTTMRFDDAAGQSARTARHTGGRPRPLGPLVSDEELAAHRAFVQTLGDDALWGTYLPKAEPAASGDT
ncbi:MAG: DNA polymerase III subunit epsilon, partial [Devosiaceae bacterium]|nr:DNA polymerase III subunit epsilon [Devosiaceae bacterium MH13]